MYAKLDTYLGALLRIVLLVTLVILCVPWSPWMPSAGLDPSWVFVLHHAFAEGWQWGKDIVFTFGPLGFNYAGMYHPATYSIMLTGQLIFLTFIGYAFFVHARKIPSILLLFIVPGIALALSHSHDLVLFTAPIILVFFANDQSRNGKFLGILFSVICGYFSLIKFTVFMLAIPLLIISVICYYIKYNKPPYYSLIFSGSFLVIYLLIGQSIGNLVPYIVGSYHIASEYSSSMQIFGPNYEIILFLGFGFLIVSWYGWTLWNSDNIIASIRLAALVIFGFMAFKASFTRHDGHAMMGFGAIFLGTFMLAGWYFSIFGPSAKKTVVYSTIILCFFYTYLGLASHLPAIGIIDHLMQPANSLISNSVTNFRNIVSAGSTERRHALTVQYASAMASIRAVHPLPNTKGMVDIFPVDQATVLAHGFDLRSRPVFQSYSVYSSLLIDKNIQFFEGGNAASHIYFKTATIDERFPNLDDGGTWPTLIKWYSFDSLSNDFAVLTRLNVPRSVKLLGISNTQLHFNEPTPIPEYKNNLWVSIKFNHKLAGNLAKIFFKLPTVGIALDYKNGTSSTHRIIPDMTDQGFLLDPPIQSGGDFALMLSGDKVSNSTVKDMEIKGNHWLDWLFVDDITVEFSELQIGELEDEHWRIAADPALAQRAVFNNLIAGAESRDGALPAITNDAGMLQLYAHAPSTMKSEPPEASQLQVKFGIRDGAWQSGKTDGVCFRISGQDEVGITVVIWERCLNPLDVEADRGEQAVTIDLSSYPRKAIVFETDINKTASWDWSYWSAIQFANP